MIPPGSAALPFADFMEEVSALDPEQRARVMGKAVWQLVESGTVQLPDVVTRTRIRPLAEVVARKGLSIADLTRAGVDEGTARRAFAVRHAAPAVPAEARHVAPAARPAPSAAVVAAPARMSPDEVIALAPHLGLDAGEVARAVGNP